jgi:hypothetical protein
MKKKYVVPDDLWDLRTKSIALNELRDTYVIMRFFGYRLARKAAIEAARLMDDFWSGIRDLYPELRGKSLRTIDGKEAVEVEVVE